MKFYDWEYDDIKAELRNLTILDLQERYVQKEKEYTDACGIYIKLSSVPEEKEKQEEICKKTYDMKVLIALIILEKMTGVRAQ